MVAFDQSEAAGRRFRTAVRRVDLNREPITADELRERGVVIKGAAAGDGPTVEVVSALLPWLELWTDHESWRTGMWRCIVDGSLQQPKYTAYRQRTLDYHTDMSRYVRPPEYTIIRCTVPDDGGGGENLLLHIDDVLARLREHGRGDITAMLAKPRPLNTEPRHRNVVDGLDDDTRTVPMAVFGEPLTPSRIFDSHGATKGSHLALSAHEQELLDEFLRLCSEWSDLAARTRLEPRGVLAFSNWRLLHARTECFGSGRVTEICMGNPREER